MRYDVPLPLHFWLLRCSVKLHLLQALELVYFDTASDSHQERLPEQAQRSTYEARGVKWYSTAQEKDVQVMAPKGMRSDKPQRYLLPVIIRVDDLLFSNIDSRLGFGCGWSRRFLKILSGGG